MSTKEMLRSLSVIEVTCGNCPFRKDCLFGKPALKIIDSESSQDVQVAAVTYIWSKRNAEVIKMCPKPEEVSNVVSVLRKS